MALGKRKREAQPELWISAADLPKSIGHVFYEKLNQLLADAGFDRWVEQICEPYYGQQGRPSIPPGVYFRMLLVGYFENIGSQRGIAWRCADSLSLRKFLGVSLSENTPEHSSLTRVRDRLPLEVHESVFRFILSVAAEKGLLRGKTVAVDATTLEANAAMKSIVRRDTKENWDDYLRRLMQETEGTENPTPDQLRNFDKKRKDKTVSNKDWMSPSDSDSRITKMKDGRTHLAYKAEHVVDLGTELVLGASIRHANEGDAQTLVDSVMEAQLNLDEAGVKTEIEEVVADKGYYSTDTVDLCAQGNLRTYIPEPKSKKKRNWRGVSDMKRRATLRNRRRTQGPRSKRLQRQRSERVERSFAHICDTGGARRTWLRGIEKVQKRYLISAMARNLGLMMRKLFGIGTPKGSRPAGGLFALLYFALINICALMKRHTIVPHIRSSYTVELSATPSHWPAPSKGTFSTGC
jgi:transposase